MLRRPVARARKLARRLASTSTRDGLQEEPPKVCAAGRRTRSHGFRLMRCRPSRGWIRDRVSREVLTWLIVQALKAKQAEPSPVLRGYAALFEKNARSILTIRARCVGRTRHADAHARGSRRARAKTSGAVHGLLDVLRAVQKTALPRSLQCVSQHLQRQQRD